MATTTNYGWTTPDDTALVKDGAAAIRTLGSSVDTTTKNLNPSTTLGDIEYRSSTSNTNTRVGIGSSGQALTVVAGVPSWAASATSVLTTTGDTLYASAGNTLARLGIGTTGQVLTVAGGLPSWATNAIGGMTLINTGGTSFSGSNFTISSIPTTYKTLKILCVNWGLNAAGYTFLQPNGSATLFTGKVVLTTTSVAIGALSASNPQFNEGFNIAGSVTDGNFHVITIDNYFSTTEYKQLVTDGTFSYSSGLGVIKNTGELRTTSAITSLKFVTDQTFNAGKVYVYGVN
jgi:hypothetical protein